MEFKHTGLNDSQIKEWQQIDALIREHFDCALVIALAEDVDAFTHKDAVSFIAHGNTAEKQGLLVIVDTILSSQGPMGEDEQEEEDDEDEDKY